MAAPGGLFDPSDHTRAKAAHDAGDGGDVASIPRLIDLLKGDPAVVVRDAAAIALGRLHAVESVPALIEALAQGTAAALRMHAAEALGEMARAEAIAPLVGHGLADETMVARAAAASLRRLPREAVVPLLLDVLRSGKAAARDHAVRLLADADEPAMLSLLPEAYARERSLSGDLREGLRAALARWPWAAAQTLAQWAARAQASAEAREQVLAIMVDGAGALESAPADGAAESVVMESILLALSNTAPAVAEGAAAALWAILPFSGPVARDTISARLARLAGRAAPAARALARARGVAVAGDPWPDLEALRSWLQGPKRGVALEALARRGMDTILARALLDDDDFERRASAAHAVAKSGLAEAEEILLEALAAEREREEALDTRGMTDAISYRLLRRKARAAIVNALAQVGTERSLAVIASEVPLAVGPHPIAEAAGGALARLAGRIGAGALPLLRDMLSSGNDARMSAAAAAMAEVPDEESVPALSALLRDRAWYGVIPALERALGAGAVPLALAAARAGRGREQRDLDLRLARLIEAHAPSVETQLLREALALAPRGSEERAGDVIFHFPVTFDYVREAAAAELRRRGEDAGVTPSPDASCSAPPPPPPVTKIPSAPARPWSDPDPIPLDIDDSTPDRDGDE